MSSRIPLVGGSYLARSVIASGQRCVNLFPEENPKDALTQLTHYQRPGFRPLVTGPSAPVRGLYRSSQGPGYCVIGQGVYQIGPTWALTHLGDLAVLGTNPVTMIDNGITLVVADNSGLGYEVVLATGAFSQVVDPTGTFTGATKLDILDGFVLWNIPGTPSFGSTLNNVVTFDPLYTAAKNNYPDQLVSLAVCRRELFLLGALKSEIWFDAGNPGFPFAELPGASFDHGCVAPYSVVNQDTSVFWLGQDLQGQGVVLRGSGYECKRISTHAIEFAIQQYPTLTDAVGYCYQQGGHVFYVLSFPSGNATWVWDDSTGLWHERAWTDSDGNLNRDRSNCGAFINGLNVVGDWQNGTLYALDQNTYTDTVGGTVGPISFIRTFPHIGAAMSASGQLVPADGKRVLFTKFQADIETGEAPLDVAGNPAQIGLRVSLDRGRSWGSSIPQSLGAPGEYLVYPQWLKLGLSRDCVLELAWNAAGPAALNGGWVDNVIQNT